MSVVPTPSSDPADSGLVGLDISRPNVARMYDYYLGGKNHYRADRAAAEAVLRTAPEARRLALENRAFLGRATRFLTAEGVRQYLDIGTGLPAQGHLMEVLQQAAGDDAHAVRVVHVDRDQVVCAHARALLAEPGRSAVVEADLRHVTSIVDSRPVRELIDFDRPVAIVLTAVMHFVGDDSEAGAAVARYREVMAPGSYLVLSHLTRGDAGRPGHGIAENVYARSSAPVTLRSPERIAGYFAGLDLVEPGLVDVALWRPEGPVGVNTGPTVIGGVARRNT